MHPCVELGMFGIESALLVYDLLVFLIPHIILVLVVDLPVIAGPGVVIQSSVLIVRHDVTQITLVDRLRIGFVFVRICIILCLILCRGICGYALSVDPSVVCDTVFGARIIILVHTVLCVHPRQCPYLLACGGAPGHLVVGIEDLIHLLLICLRCHLGGEEKAHEQGHEEYHRYLSQYLFLHPRRLAGHIAQCRNHHLITPSPFPSSLSWRSSGRPR